MPSILDKVLRIGEGRIVKRLNGLALQVNALEDSITGLSDAELREETDRFKARLADGESLDDLLPEEAGIRAQAVLRDGALVHDFLVRRTDRTVHVCNAPSPAATSAFPIARHVVDLATATA